MSDNGEFWVLGYDAWPARITGQLAGNVIAGVTGRGSMTLLSHCLNFALTKATKSDADSAYDTAEQKEEAESSVVKNFFKVYLARSMISYDTPFDTEVAVLFICLMLIDKVQPGTAPARTFRGDTDGMLKDVVKKIYDIENGNLAPPTDMAMLGQIFLPANIEADMSVGGPSDAAAADADAPMDRCAAEN